MNKAPLLGATALRSFVVFCVTVSAAQTASAQEAATPVNDPSTEATTAATANATAAVDAQTAQAELDCDATPNAPECTSIVVTGSRIRRPNLESTVPITSVGPQDLTSRGEVSLGDALNDLPSMRSTFSQANSTTSIGTAGLSLLDLRGLGTTRTLVLVNGRRTVTAQPGNFNVDINTMPVDLLERADVVTGGNSAIYGSDAIAGVVNFILRRDFEGVKVRGQAGTSTYGDRGNKFASIVAGKSLFDSRLNITGHLEYSDSDELFFSDRRYLGAYTGVPGFYTSERTNAPNRNFNGIPNTAFWDIDGGNTPGITFGNISTGGYVLTACPAPNATNSVQRGLVCTGQTTPTGGLIASNYAFMPDGTLARDIPFFDNRAIGGGVFGGLSATGVEDAMLLPGLERYVGNLFLNGDISPALKPFMEATYVRVNATQQNNQPTFVASSLSPLFRIDNPFLTTQASTLLNQITAPTLSTAQQNACRARFGATVNRCFTMQRFNNDLGTRAEDHQRDTYRLVTGVRGDLSDTSNLNYEVALNFGKTRTFYETGGNVLVANFNNATNAIRNSAGEIVCAINADASTTNDDPNCAPLNLFGYGASSQAARDYVLYTSSRVEKARQINAVAFISGDTESFFRLPGGPVGFAVGGEYRREKASSKYDEVTRSGATFLNAFEPFTPPEMIVREAFGELRLPLLKDIKFIKDLTVEGAARYSNYKGKIGGVWAYNAGINYSPFKSLRLRGGFAQSVRAPNLTNSFAAATQTFANGLTDPCDQPGGTNSSNNITSNPERAENCAAAGVPTTITYVNNSGATVTAPWVNQPQSGVVGINRGNPDLVPEKGRSLTLGGVFQPSFIPGLGITVDYYRIKVKDVISGLTGQQIINRCYDDPTGINNEFCAAVARRTSTDPLLDATFAGQSTRTLPNLSTFSMPVVGNAFVNQPFNFAALVRRGVDFDVSYSHPLPVKSGAVLSLRGIASLLLKSENFSYLTQPDRSDKIDETFGDPRWGASWSANLDFGKLDFTYSGVYNGRQAILAWETQFTHQGRGPTNPDARPIKWYHAQALHNLRVNFDPVEQYRFYVGVDNVRNARPPYDLTGIEAGSTYNPTGRYFYAGAQLRFK